MLSMLNKAGERSPSEGQRCETACQQGAAAVSSRVVTLTQALKLTKYQPPIKAKLSLTPSGGSRHSTDTDGQVSATIGRSLALNNASAESGVAGFFRTSAFDCSSSERAITSGSWMDGVAKAPRVAVRRFLGLAARRVVRLSEKVRRMLDLHSWISVRTRRSSCAQSSSSNKSRQQQQQFPLRC